MSTVILQATTLTPWIWAISCKSASDGMLALSILRFIMLVAMLTIQSHFFEMAQDRPFIHKSEVSINFAAVCIEKNFYRDRLHFESRHLLLMDAHILFQFIRPGKASCSYGQLVKDEMAVFDPGRNVDFYEQFAKDQGCRIVKSFETQLQADYISGSQELSKRTSAAIFGHENDFQHAVFKSTSVKDGDVFRLSAGDPVIRAVPVPGHTPGSTSYLVDNTCLISGDAIFILSIGRPDLGGKAVAWAKLLFKTIKTQIAAPDDSTVVLPGHYMDWKEMDGRGLFADLLGHVRERNADIYGIGDEKSFIKFIQDNMRPQPGVYARIRPVNAGLTLVDDDEQEVMDLGKNECAASTHPK